MKNGSLQKIIMDKIKNQASTLSTLPSKVNKYLTKANHGELEFEISNLDKNTNKLYTVSQKILFGLLASIFFSAMLAIYTR